ncbi:MAG: outer membrane beta-barrel protein [Deltaproteobacteria bacterium]|nr:outer membrane beta-barrel protein [Deltaproteobacteria bacterium]
MKRGKWAALVVAGMMFIASPALAAEMGLLAIGAQGGYAVSVAGDAEDGVAGTDFDNNFIFGGGLTYRFPFGLALELDAHYLSFDYRLDDVKFGSVRQVPAMLWAKWQGLPESGLTGHAGVGLGLSFNDADVTQAWNEYLTGIGVDLLTLAVDVDNSVVFGVDAGLDYFTSPQFSISLDVRFLYSLADYRAKVEGVEVATGQFNCHSLSIMAGFKYWFSLN